LNFVSDTDPASGANHAVNGLQISARRDDLPANRRESFSDEPDKPVSLAAEVFDRGFDQRGKLLCPVWVIAAKAAAKIVGDLNQFDPIGLPNPARFVEFVGRNIKRAGGVAVVSVVRRDDPLLSCMCPRKAQRELIRL